MKCLLSLHWPLKRTWRRFVVIIQILLILGIAFYDEWYIITSSQHSSTAQDWYYVLWQVLLIIAFVAITFLLRSSIKPFIGRMAFFWFARNVKLDEHQQFVRDRALRIAYRFSLFLLLGTIILISILFAPRLVVPPHGVLFWFQPFLCITQLILSLPLFVIAWTEPDVEDDEDNAAVTAPTYDSGKVLKFRRRIK